MSDKAPHKPEYLPYPRAMQALHDRLGATPGELAVWVMYGEEPDCGGIAAYLDANISDHPRQLIFDCWSPDDFDYIAPLMGAWFLASDIAEFNPPSRYIEYPRLVSRWRETNQLEDIEAYIFAKVREDRLAEVHPVTGRSELGWLDREYPRPVKETTMLDLADVEAIEQPANPFGNSEPSIRPASLNADGFRLPFASLPITPDKSRSCFILYLFS
jgi:hypothetical protein